MNSSILSQSVGFGGKVSVFNALMGAFLMFNVVIRFCTIFYYPPYNGYIAAFFGGLVCCCIFVIFFPKYLKAFLFLFGFSFFLFGFGSIDIQSRVFELIVTCVATALFVINWRAWKDRGQGTEDGRRRTEDGGQGSGVRSRGSVEQAFGYLDSMLCCSFSVFASFIACEADC